MRRGVRARGGFAAVAVDRVAGHKQGALAGRNAHERAGGSAVKGLANHDTCLGGAACVLLTNDTRDDLPVAEQRAVDKVAPVGC